MKLADRLRKWLGGGGHPKVSASKAARRNRKHKDRNPENLGVEAVSA
jgi:hypothetical protein